jgi:hypothetical protein
MKGNHMPSKKQGPLDVARSTLNDLTNERDRSDAKLVGIAAEREQIAHAALTGDNGARERLEELKREVAHLTEHGKDLAAAIVEAERNFNCAREAERRTKEVEAANRRKALAVSLRAAGERADRGAQEFAEAIAEIEALSRDPEAVGIRFLEMIFLRPHIMNAAHAAFQPMHPFMPPLERRSFAPGDRHSFGEVLGGWADRIDEEADQVIAGKAEATKEAA